MGEDNGMDSKGILVRPSPTNHSWLSVFPTNAHWADLGVQVAWIHYLASIHVNLYPLAAQSAVLGYWEAGRWFGRDAVIPMIILPTPNYYCFITFGKRMSNLQSRYNRDCEYLICCHISSRPPPLSSLTSVVRPAGLEYSWLSGAASCNTQSSAQRSGRLETGPVVVRPSWPHHFRFTKFYKT